MRTSTTSAASGIAAVILLMACTTQAQKTLSLTLQGSTTGSGPALSGTTSQTTNTTVTLPAAGPSECVSVEGLGNAEQPYFSVGWDSEQLPSGSVLTLYSQANCTEPLNVAAFYPEGTGYTVKPGIVGDNLDVFGSFLSLQFSTPIAGGILQDGFYNLLAESPYTDSGECNTYISASPANASLGLALTDDKTGLAQFHLQLIKAPDHYHIRLVRGRLDQASGALEPAVYLTAPGCSDGAGQVTLQDVAAPSSLSTWVINSVAIANNGVYSSGLGFQANITSLSRLDGTCSALSNSTLGLNVQSPLDATSSGCLIEPGAVLVAGDSVTDLDGYGAGLWTLIPVSPVYCNLPGSLCGPGGSSVS